MLSDLIKENVLSKFDHRKKSGVYDTLASMNCWVRRTRAGMKGKAATRSPPKREESLACPGGPACGEKQFIGARVSSRFFWRAWSTADGAPKDDKTDLVVLSAPLLSALASGGADYSCGFGGP